MNITKIPDGDMASMAANILTLLAGTDLSAIDSHVRAELVTAFGTLPATLALQTEAADVAEGVRKSLFSERNMTRSLIDLLIAQVRDALKAGRAPKSQYDLAGLNYPVTPPNPYVAADPTDLSVAGFSNGINKGRFSGNNKNGRVTYDIWRRQGDDGAWAPHTLTKKQTFTDTGVTPGQYYEYRVRAVASKSTSNFSNSAVVYGVL